MKLREQRRSERPAQPLVMPATRDADEPTDESNAAAQDDAGQGAAEPRRDDNPSAGAT